jgi:small subunit ribosomal protein S4
MGRYTGPVCKLCRREGQKLFLKGTKCYTEKCPIERRNYAPGQHGLAQVRRRKTSEYAQQLREKQKVKRIYGVSEKYFRTLFVRAAKQAGVTGENLLIGLELRLDNVLYRMNFASSRSWEISRLINIRKKSPSRETRPPIDTFDASLMRFCLKPATVRE